MVIMSLHIFTLPIKSTYILVMPQLREKVKRILTKNGGLDKAARELKIERDYLYRFLVGKKCSLDFLFKLYNRLGLDIRLIEKNILLIVSGKSNGVGIKNPTLPFEIDNEYGGILLGAIMGDGSRTKLGGLTYNNQNEQLVRNVVKSAQKIFGDVHYRLSPKKDGTLQLDLPKIVGDAVSRLGIERSYKTVSDCYVNLSEFSDSFKTGFVRQFFDDEGNIRKKDRRVQIKQTRDLTESSKESVRENIKKFAPKVLLKIYDELENLGIRSKLSLECMRFDKGKIKGDFSLNIYGKEYLEKFERLINFTIGYKRNLLREAIESYKFPSAPRNERIGFAVRHAESVQNKHGFITKHLLARESERSLKTATYFLVDLKKKGLVRVVEKSRKEDGAPLPQKYLLTEKARIS